MKDTTLTIQEIKCLRKHLKPLLQILEKLDKEEVTKSSPKSKPETKKERENRISNLIEERESRRHRK